jgi:hypothetical protein
MKMTMVEIIWTSSWKMPAWMRKSSLGALNSISSLFKVLEKMDCQNM